MVEHDWIAYMQMLMPLQTAAAGTAATIVSERLLLMVSKGMSAVV